MKMDNLRSLLGIMKMDKALNVHIRELCGERNGMDERINKSILRWFGHTEKIENDRMAKSVYVGKRAGNGLVGQPRKSWIDSANDDLKKKKKNLGEN